jgi:hypothetical protein
MMPVTKNEHTIIRTREGGQMHYMNGGTGTGSMTIEIISPEDRPNFRSMAKASWRDVNGKEHQQYMIRPMKSGLGFEVIDTDNFASVAVRDNFKTPEEAREFLRATPAP